MKQTHRATKFTTVLLALAVLFSFGTAALAADGEGVTSDAEKTLTVDAAGEEYATIQSAIDYISQQEDKENWTINVKGGEYGRFTVLGGLNGLTVQAAENESVIIKTLDGSAAPAEVSGGFPDTGGISVRDAVGVTIKGFNITMGNVTTPWHFAAISNYSESGVKGNGLTVEECTISGNGSMHGVFINTGTTEWNVRNCTFENIDEAISLYGDGTLMQGAEVTGNTFKNCSFALHGYYGGTGEAGVLTFAGNTVYGTEELRSKIVVQDQTNTGAIKVDVRDNILNNAIVGLVNLREDGENMSDVLGSNTMNAGSFYVEAVEPGTIDFYTSYQAPENGAGYWVLNENSFDNPEFVDYVRELVETANIEHQKVLNITVDDEGELIKTFTWFKDALYWESIGTGDLTVSKTVEGTGGDKEKEFTFTVTLNDKYITGTYGDMIFKDGVATFTLKHGESVKAVGLPEGIEYTVSESGAEGYTVTADGETGAIVAGETAEAVFVNHMDIVDPEPEDPKPEEPDTKPETPSGDENVPQTGDENSMAVWTVLLIAAEAALAGTSVVMVKRKKD